MILVLPELVCGHDITERHNTVFVADALKIIIIYPSDLGSYIRYKRNHIYVLLVLGTVFSEIIQTGVGA